MAPGRKKRRKLGEDGEDGHRDELFLARLFLVVKILKCQNICSDHRRELEGEKQGGIEKM